MTVEKKNYIAAIDLGSSNVAVVVGRPAADGKIEVDAVSVKKSRGVVRGEVRNVEQAAQSIREAVREVEEKLNIKIHEVVTGISGSHINCVKHPYFVYVRSKDGEVFQEDVDNLNRSMSSVQAPEGHQLLRILPQHYVVSDTTDEVAANPVGMIGQTLGSTFNLITGENAIISRLEKALQRINIRNKHLYINPLATAEAVTYPDEKDLGVAVVDFGGGTTDICIYQDGIVRYIGVIPLGAYSINKDIRSYGIMERYIEELKINYGCAILDMVDSDKSIQMPGYTPNDHKEISFKNLAAIIEPRATEIIEFILEEIKASGYEEKLNAGIILTGGSAELKEFKTLLERMTKMKIRVGAPKPLVTEESKELVNNSFLSVGVGLLFEGISDGIETYIEELEPVEPEPEVAETINEALGQQRDELPNKAAAPEEERELYEEERRPRKGIFKRIRNAFEDTFDLRALDDDDII